MVVNVSNNHKTEIERLICDLLKFGVIIENRIHNVFHVSCLKKMLGKHQTIQTILPMLDDEERVIWEPKAIIATRERKLHSRTLKEYLIRWNNFLDEDASWETE